MAPPRKRALPKPLPEGFILTDSEKKRWRLGKIIGQGGCGLIYLASQDVSRPVAVDTDFVIKVEDHENGPLFSELKFYQRAAKPESMQKWKRSRHLDFLGIPTYWGSGLAEYNELRYRFMAMDRLGSDLQKVCERSRGRLKKATVLQLGQRLVDVLEYIHENEYVHADIKAANLMLGFRDPEQVYLADYGLSYRYCPDGVHKEYKENPKKGHNGTIEYTSIDAHKGLVSDEGRNGLVEALGAHDLEQMRKPKFYLALALAPSRRGDLQILGFCLLHWLCGSLPWDKFLKNPTQVQEVKDRLMDNLPESVQQLSVSGASTGEVADFLSYVKTLDYQEKPNYQHLKRLLASVVTGRLDFSVPEGPATKLQAPPTREKKAGRIRGSKAKVEEEEEEGRRSKPVAARYIRGPPLTKAQPQKADRASPAVSRSLRTKTVVDYGEDDSEAEEEEEARARPIPACYLRGPPIGPRAPLKQKTKWSSRKADDLMVTSERRQRQLQPRRKNHTVTQEEDRETWRERLLFTPSGSVQQRWTGVDLEECGSAQRGVQHRADYSQQPRFLCCECSHSSAPTHTKQLLPWFVFAGVFFLLGVVFVSQGAFKQS